MGTKTKKCQYTYKQAWTNEHVDSNSFCKTDKPKSCKFPGGDQKAVENTGSIPKNVAFDRKVAPEFKIMIGEKENSGYLLNAGLIGSLTESIPVNVEAQAAQS